MYVAGCAALLLIVEVLTAACWRQAFQEANDRLSQQLRHATLEQHRRQVRHARAWLLSPGHQSCIAHACCVVACPAIRDPHRDPHPTAQGGRLNTAPSH